MAESTSLSQMLIEGAGKAVAYDPEGLVAAAADEALKKITDPLKRTAEMLATAKKEKQDKIDTQTKQNEADWRNITDKMEKNLGGLDIPYWQKADDYVSSTLKPKYDACPPGEEGRRCRTEARMELNTFVTETEAAKGALNALHDTQKKMDSKDLALSKSQTFEQKAILGQLTGENASLGGVKDAEISELEAQKDALVGKKGMLREGVDQTAERARIQEQIDALKKNNPMEYGWNIEYEDKDGKIVNKRVTKDMLPDLLPHQAKEITTGLETQTKEALVQSENLKTGAAGAKKFDLEKSAATYEDSVTSDNIKSVYKDSLYGGKETLEDHLRLNPVITNLNYEDLGIDIPEVDKDGVIDPEEWVKLGTEDVDKIISALSEPENFELGQEVAADYMALKTQKAVNTELYGEGYYPEPSGPISEDTGRPTYTSEDLTINDYLGKGKPVSFASPKEYQDAIRYDRTNLRENESGELLENKNVFLDRGGCIGCIEGGGGEVLRTAPLGTVVEKVQTYSGSSDELLDTYLTVE